MKHVERCQGLGYDFKFCENLTTDKNKGKRSFYVYNHRNKNGINQYIRSSPQCIDVIDQAVYRKPRGQVSGLHINHHAGLVQPLHKQMVRLTLEYGTEVMTNIKKTNQQKYKTAHIILSKKTPSTSNSIFKHQSIMRIKTRQFHTTHSRWK